MSKLRVHDENDVMIGWKAWYVFPDDDLTTYTSEFNKWVDIPVNNFQCLKVFYDRNIDVYAGMDLYCISDNSDEIEKLIREDSRNIKVGRAISKEDWENILLKYESDKEIIKVMI